MTKLYGTNFDGNAVAPFAGMTWPSAGPQGGFYVGNSGGTYANTFTVLNGQVSPRYFGPFNSAGGNILTYDRWWASGGGNYGNNNNKVAYAGPFNFTGETTSPVIVMRIYKYTETYYDRLWVGWDQQGVPPPTLYGHNGYTTGPLNWDYFTTFDANCGTALSRICGCGR
jgi:hypothetical protein